MLSGGVTASRHIDRRQIQKTLRYNLSTVLSPTAQVDLYRIQRRIHMIILGILSLFISVIGLFLAIRQELRSADKN